MVPPLGSYPTMNGNLKRCARCKKWKHRREFVHSNRVSSGKGSYCKPCHVKNSAISAYGANVIDYDDIGECEICGSSENLRIDHYQPNGKPKTRGILCHRCNIALGLFGHKIELLLLASLYLEERGV